MDETYLVFSVELGIFLGVLERIEPREGAARAMYFFEPRDKSRYAITEIAASDAILLSASTVRVAFEAIDTSVS